MTPNNTAISTEQSITQPSSEMLFLVSRWELTQRPPLDNIGGWRGTLEHSVLNGTSLSNSSPQSSGIYVEEAVEIL